MLREQRQEHCSRGMVPGWSQPLDIERFRPVDRFDSHVPAAFERNIVLDENVFEPLACPMELRLNVKAGMGCRLQTYPIRFVVPISGIRDGLSHYRIGFVIDVQSSERNRSSEQDLTG